MRDMGEGVGVEGTAAGCLISDGGAEMVQIGVFTGLITCHFSSWEVLLPSSPLHCSSFTRHTSFATSSCPRVTERVSVFMGCMLG